MVVNLKDIPEVEQVHFKGGDGSYFSRSVDDGCCKIMQGRLEPGSSIGLHRHVDSCEVIYILQGEGTVIADGTREHVAAGEVSYCAKDHEHTLINDSDTDLIFIGVVPKQ